MENLFKMYHRRHSEIVNRYWPIRQPVLANSPTGIDQFANRYWPIRQPVLANSPTGIGQINNRYWRNHQPLNQGTSWQFDQYRLAIWPIPVGDLVNTGWRIGQYRLANWSIPVGELANTGWRIGQYRLANSECRRWYILNKFAIILWGHLLSIVFGQLFISWRFHFVLKKSLLRCMYLNYRRGHRVVTVTESKFVAGQQLIHNLIWKRVKGL